MLSSFSEKVKSLVGTPVTGSTHTQRPLLHCICSKFPVAVHLTYGEVSWRVRQSTSVMESVKKKQNSTCHMRGSVSDAGGWIHVMMSIYNTVISVNYLVR